MNEEKLHQDKVIKEFRERFPFGVCHYSPNHKETPDEKVESFLLQVHQEAYELGIEKMGIEMLNISAEVNATIQGPIENDGITIFQRQKEHLESTLQALKKEK